MDGWNTIVSFLLGAKRLFSGANLLLVSGEWYTFHQQKLALRIRLYVLRIRDFPYNPMTWGWDWDHQSYEFSGGVGRILRVEGCNFSGFPAEKFPSYKVGPLPVITGVITPISRVITPVTHL